MKVLLVAVLLAMSSITLAQDIILRGMCVESVENNAVTITPCAKKSNLIIGDGSWINPANLHAGWSGKPEDYTEIVGAGDGRNAGLFATRTSDVGEDSMYWTLGSICNNNSLFKSFSYCFYGEGFKQASAHWSSYLHIAEFDVINRHPHVAKTDPFNINALGATEGMRIVVGDLGGEVAYDASHALGIVPNPGDQQPRFRNGIVFAHDSLTPGGSALMMAEGQRISWHAENGRVTRVTVIDGKLVID